MMALLGVSLTRRISFLSSLMQTLTALEISVSAMPLANLATDDSLQGATNIASYLKLPEAMEANIWSSSKTWSAMASTCSTV